MLRVFDALGALTDTLLDHLAKHGVDFHEAGTVLDDPLSTTFPDPEHS